jgi:hypothetical protein
MADVVSEGLLDVRCQFRRLFFKLFSFSLSLHADGHEFRLRLQDEEDESRSYLSQPLALAKARPLELALTRWLLSRKATP